jgi:hypothetical protein
MYLVHKEYSLLTHYTAAFGSVHDFFYFLYTARDGAEVYEARLGFARDDAGERRFADAGRPPKYHGRRLVAVDHTAQDFTLAEKMRLPDEFIEVSRPKTDGQWICHDSVVKKGLLLHGLPLFVFQCLFNFSHPAAREFLRYVDLSARGTAQRLVSERALQVIELGIHKLHFDLAAVTYPCLF